MTTVFFSLSASPMGMALVVCGLLLLVGFVWAVARLSGMRAAAGKAAREKAEGSATPYPLGGASQGPPPEAVAAIVAAISAVWEGEGGFAVRRIKRVSHAPVWNRAGRDEQIYSRL